MANKKDLILSSGFTYKELLMIKGYFQYIRRHYYKPHEPMTEDENLKEVILIMARLCFWSPFNFLILCPLLTYSAVMLTDNISIIVPIFITTASGFIIGIQDNAKIFNVRYLTIIKLMILRVRARKLGLA